MAQAKEIKTRLKSIKNTQKTTKAMELVAGAKMRKAVARALDTREYHNLLWDIVERLRDNSEAEVTDELADFFAAPQARAGEKIQTTIVMYTSNRGLCGAFNSNVVKEVVKYIEEHPEETVEIIGVGKRGTATMQTLGQNVTLAFEKDDSAEDDTSVRDIATQLHSKFTEKKTDKILVAFTDYRSAVEQVATLKRLFPLKPESKIAATVETIEKPKEEIETPSKSILFTYEPSPARLLESIVPRIIEVELYQALLESNASEHSARMIAMKNATDAAKDMAQELTLLFNRARQASITQEIAEISAGAASVS